MDCGCANTGISIYFQCRILAAKNNVYLKSRESAAEYFGISVSSLANYERGITVPPIIKSWPQLRYGNLVDVCDVVNATDGSRWYYVRIDGRIYGFVHSAYIARA